MFHVYFGGFDFVMYAIAALIAICLADVICNEMDEQEQFAKESKKEVTTTQPVHLSGSQEEVATGSPLILDIQIYELHGQLVVKMEDISIAVPGKVKTFSLRGDRVIRLSDLQDVYGKVAIDASQVISKWEQWNQQKKTKPKRQHRKPIQEVASLNSNGGAGHGTVSAFSV
jgi:glutamate dehydrogenase/leucine dehydrogenase